MADMLLIQDHPHSDPKGGQVGDVDLASFPLNVGESCKYRCEKKPMCLGNKQRKAREGRIPFALLLLVLWEATAVNQSSRNCDFYFPLQRHGC